jgi:protein-arginine deiminase
LADSNRDGLVNELDHHNKTVWSTDRGAIFLPNVGDRYFRCPVTDLTGRELSNKELAACNDASGDTLLEPGLAAPLQTVPLHNISSVAVASIYVAEPASAKDRVRLFWHMGSNPEDIKSWMVVNQQVTFNATSLRRGIKLAIDSRELVTNALIWDGAVTIGFKVTDRNCKSIDHVTLKQAPVLLHHHLQHVDTVLITDGKHAPSPWQGYFVRLLQESLASVLQAVDVVALDGVDDIWTQDFLEPGYVNVPGPNGTISLRVLLRSAQSSRKAGRQIFSS